MRSGKKLLRRAVTAVGLALIVGLFSMTLFQKKERGDLEKILEGARRLVAGEVVYDSIHTNSKPPVGTLFFYPLSRLSERAAGRVWDIVNFALLIFFLVHFANQFFPGASPADKSFLRLLCLLFLLNQFNTELRVGQINLFLLFLVYAAGRVKSAAVSGVAFSIAFLVKPTYVLFLPWILLREAKKSFLIWSGVATVFFCAMAIGILTWTRFVNAHLQWRAFMDMDINRHLSIGDNDLLLSLVNVTKLYFPPTEINWGVMQMVGLGICALLCSLLRGNRKAAFALTVAMSLMFNVLSRTANYSQLIPYVFLVFASFHGETSRPRRALLALALFFLYAGFQLSGPAFRQSFLWQLVSIPAIEFWALFSSCLILGFVGIWRGVDRPVYPSSQDLNRALGRT